MLVYPAFAHAGFLVFIEGCPAVWIKLPTVDVFEEVREFGRQHVVCFEELLEELFHNLVNNCALGDFSSLLEFRGMPAVLRSEPFC